MIRTFHSCYDKNLAMEVALGMDDKLKEKTQKNVFNDYMLKYESGRLLKWI